MISNEDRVEAARFLRSCNCCGDSYVKCSEISEALFGNKNAICNSGASLEKIADLIDRPTCTIVNSWQRVTPGLDELDLDDIFGFELSCGHEILSDEKPNYCLKCGAVVVDED